MIDAEAEIRLFLAGQAVLTALVGSRIYAATDTPVVGYKPHDGPAICFKVRGGQVETEQDVLLAPSVQFKCYGKDEATANACYQTLFDVLNQGRGGTMRYALAEGLGQLLQDTEQDKEWWFKLVYFTCWLDNS